MSEMPAWVESYRGRPFLRGADGPDAFDCYGLVRAVLRDVWGAVTPALDGAWHLSTAARLALALEDAACPWTAADSKLAPGDVLTFHAPSDAAELHVGIVVSPGFMLHARQDAGVTTARYDRAPWAVLRFGAAWRHVGVPS